MAERRGLGAAMSMTPEKLAFIKGSMTTKELSDQSPAETPAEVTEAVTPESAEVSPSASRSAETPRARGSRPARSRDASIPRSHPRTELDEREGFYGPILVPLTTRLEPKTADALRRACLEQKLARRSPDTQQEIVEIALKRWLRDNEFLDV